VGRQRELWPERETERAAAIVTRWLRPKLEPAAPVLGAAE
jgi:hypothetical protein